MNLLTNVKVDQVLGYYAAGTTVENRLLLTWLVTKGACSFLNSEPFSIPALLPVMLTATRSTLLAARILAVPLLPLQQLRRLSLSRQSLLTFSSRSRRPAATWKPQSLLRWLMLLFSALQRFGIRVNTSLN